MKLFQKTSNAASIINNSMDNNKQISSVLLVDDDDTTNFINKVLLEKLNVADQIHIAKNGQEAIDFINNAGSNYEVNYTHKLPELIFLDINMPVMDGFEFLKLFKKIEHDHDKKVVIVLLSNLHRTDADEMMAFKTATIEFLEKPLTVEKISTLLETHFVGK